MKKFITIIAVIMMAFTGFAEGKIQRVLYEHPKGDYKIVLQMDPTDVHPLNPNRREEGIKAATITMKACALAAGWDGWYSGWMIMFPKEPSRNSKTYRWPERDKVVAGENGKFADLIFDFITPQDIEEAQKLLDAGCSCVEILIYETAYEGDPLIGCLQMYSCDYWIGIWNRDVSKLTLKKSK